MPDKAIKTVPVVRVGEAAKTGASVSRYPKEANLCREGGKQQNNVDHVGLVSRRAVTIIARRLRYVVRRGRTSLVSRGRVATIIFRRRANLVS